MDKSFSDILYEMRRKNDLNQEDLADLLQVTRATISDYERGKSVPPLASLIKIADKFHILLDELVGRNVNLIKNEKINRVVNPTVNPIVNPIEKSEANRGVPLYPIKAIAGSPGGDISVKENEAEGYYDIPEFRSSYIDFLVKVKGESMSPEYQDGDMIGVQKINDLAFFQWGKVYILDTNQGPLIKRLYPCEENSERIVCHSDNAEKYPRFNISMSSIRNLYLVLASFRIRFK